MPLLCARQPSALATGRSQVLEVHDMARRVQEIVREGSQRTLIGLRPIEVARGMAAQPQHLLNLLHVGAFIGAARTPKLRW